MTAEEREVLLRQLKEHGVTAYREGDVFVRMAPTETVFKLPPDEDDGPVDPRFGLEKLYEGDGAGVD